MSMPSHYHGSCLCGSVRYEIAGAIETVSHCHCSMCRKAHGAAFATYGSVHAENHRFVAGLDALRGFQSSAAVTRTFCALCGSPLLWTNLRDFAGWVSFPLGSLDTPYVAPRHRHIQVASKAPWYEIEDRWPQADQY